MDIEGLKVPSIKFWSLWDDDKLIGCGALKILEKDHGEFKSIRLHDDFRNKGNGIKLIDHLLPIMNSSPSEVIAAYKDEVDRKIISQIMVEEDSSIDFMQMSLDCISSLKKDYARLKIQQFRQKIREFEAEGKDTTELMSKVLQMQKDMNA